MKTRDEMIYDFMVSLTSNSAIFDDWDAASEILGSYGDHIKAIAEEMANKVLGI